MTSLISEIINLLNNEDTSCEERLSFADNAFVSPTLPMRQKEIYLLKWIFNSSSILDKYTLQLCLKWITSSQIIDLNRSDLSAVDLIELTNSLSTVSSNARKDCFETQELLFSIFTAFIENKIFQHHFKFNMELYYLLLSTFIANIDKESLIASILTNDQLLAKSLPIEYKSLINGCLWSFVKIAAKYPTSDSIFNAISNIINRCLFKPNINRMSSTLIGFFSKSKRLDVDIFAVLFEFNSEIKSSERQMYYKLLLHSFYKCAKDFSTIYKFIIILLKNLGILFGEILNCRPILSINSDSDEGIPILVQLFEIISKNKNDFECKIEEISFNDFIKHFAEVRFKQPPCKETLQLTNIIFKMNASLIHELTDQLIIYLLLNNFENMQPEYNNLFKLLIDTYFKLHRIPGLVHKLLAAPVDGPSNVAIRIIQDDSFRFHDEFKSTIPEAASYNIQSTLSPEILLYLSNCIVQLVSNQSINIFMTLLHKFDVAIKNLDATIDEPKRIFILEIITTLLCQVLSSVRFADNTISDAIMSKFVHIMEQIKDSLQIFGTSLVSLKHEPRMMRAFLNTSFTWAELYITSEYYSINKNIACKKDTNFSDSSTCNISYLHNYLTSEQWGLISERITNFGETPCKQLLHKLFMQKLKAMYLFGPEINKDVFHSVQQTTISSMRIVWNLLLTDQFALDVLLPTIDYKNKRILANYLILDIIKNREESSFFEWKVVHDMDFNKALLTNLMQEMGKLLRTKRKREDTSYKSNSTKLLKGLLNDDTLDEERLIEIFVECIGKEDSVQNTYNEGQMKIYLSLLKHMPISNFSDHLQITIFCYLCALLQDIKTVTVDRVIIIELESFILSTLQISSLPIIGKMPITALIPFIEQNFNCYSNIFEQILSIFVKNEICAPGLSTGITLLIKSAKANKKYIDLCLITMETLIKHTNFKKISTGHKALLEEYHNDMSSKLIKLMVDKKVHSIDMYSCALNIALNKGNTGNMEILLPLLNEYFKHSIAEISHSSQISGMLLLFVILVKNQTTLTMEEADSTLSIWNACKNVLITENDNEIYSRLIVLIFETISNEQFEKLLDDISQSITTAIANNDELGINWELKRCTSILPCMFNGTKLALWTKSLQQYLFKLSQYFCEKIPNHTILKFLLNLQNCTKMNLTPVMLDLSFIITQKLLCDVNNIDDFITSFPAGYSILESLIKHRKLFVLDRLPAYLQQYRHLLTLLCKYSDISKSYSDNYMDKCKEYAHSLEKLTTYIVSTGKHTSRINQYLITDFLKHYETITLHASVKYHLNNCIFELMSLCDSHAVAYLMRSLSTASTEMFKLLYETYQKYYKFTGKV